MVLFGNSERKRPLGRPRGRWEDNFNGSSNNIFRGDDWINLAEDGDEWRALVNKVMNLRVPYKACRFLTS